MQTHGTANEITHTGTYDGLDRFGRVKDQYWVQPQVAPAEDVPIDRFAYTHDYASNRLTRDNQVGSHLDEKYTYDGLHRLTDADRGTLSGGNITTKKFEQNWSLDAMGNWTGFSDDQDGNGFELVQPRYHNTVNEIDGNSGDPIDATTGINWYDPTYDAAGNMQTGPKPGAEKDDDEDGRKHKYTFDAWNRLVKVQESATDEESWANVAEYEYDSLGRRIVKFLDARESGAETRHYYYVGQQMVMERKGSLDASLVDTIVSAPIERYLYHPYYIDAPAIRWHDANEDGDFDDANEEQCYTHDANYNVTALLNDDGDVLERYHYDPYGKVSILNGGSEDEDGDEWTLEDSDGEGQDGDGVSDYHNPYLYTGRRLDEETGLQYSRARYYHATLGRFMQRDPMVSGFPDFQVDPLLGTEALRSQVPEVMPVDQDLLGGLAWNALPAGVLSAMELEDSISQLKIRNQQQTIGGSSRLSSTGLEDAILRLRAAIQQQPIEESSGVGHDVQESMGEAGEFYEYAQSNPIINTDPSGLRPVCGYCCSPPTPTKRPGRKVRTRTFCVGTCASPQSPMWCGCIVCFAFTDWRWDAKLARWLPGAGAHACP
ncbi:MAG: hypothetical protein HQ567_14790 [Candidatus Nealsonbacteria bacterium]|nr:hypothetical protein [Candidatus Nealsonbacteria bacterium]